MVGVRPKPFAYRVVRSPGLTGSRRYSRSSRGFARAISSTLTKPRKTALVSAEAIRKVGIDVFPNNFPVSGDFEKRPKEASLINDPPFGRR